MLSEAMGEAREGFPFVQATFHQEMNAPVDQVLENIRTNSLRLTLPRIGLKRAVFVGGGPSVADHVDEIRALRASHHIFALNGSARWLIERGVVPHFHLVMDARPGNVDFVTPPHPDVHYLIASQCDPSVFDALTGHKLYMWHAGGVQGMESALSEHEGTASLITGGSTVGLRGLMLAQVMGYREFILFGYDSSNRAGDSHAYAQPMNDGQPMYTFMHRGELYAASGPMASQAEQFPKVAKGLIALGCQIDVRGGGLLPAMWRHQQEIDAGPLETREAHKYTRMWATPQYRADESRLGLVDEAIRIMEMQPGAKVIDYGCGTGKALAKFRDQGFDVLGVDITPSCLSDDSRVPLVIAPLWDLPPIKGDYGYCTDVMEHMPTEKVNDVLARILGATPRVYFQIAHFPDSGGALISERLHLTVQPHRWWLDRFLALGFRVPFAENGGATSRFYVTSSTT